MYTDLAEVRAELCAPGQMFEIEEVEVRGVRVKAWCNAATSLREVWLQTAAHGDAEYLVYEDDRWTYAQAHESVARFANWMAAQGIGHGDRVAIAMRNYPEWLLAYWATVSLGAVVVGINAWWVAGELAYGLKDSTPKLMICDEERLARFREVSGELHDMAVVAVRARETLPSGVRSWDEVLAAPAKLPDADIHPDDDACIFYTSGTTGNPKGAQLTHRGCTNNILSTMFGTLSQLLAQGRADGGEPASPPAGKTAVLITTPLFHVTANNVIAHTNTVLGNKLVHMYRWDAGEAIRLIEREKINALSGVPVMAREVIAHPDFTSADTSSLQSLGGGGAALQPDLVEKIDAGSAAQPLTGYGLTEVCGLASGLGGAYFRDRPRSVGPVLPVFDVRCMDEAGNEVPTGERGEIQLRGAQVIKGYLNRPEATAEAIIDGWLRTGDIGYLDEDGFLHIVDRAKDMVLRGGENVYCAEVEAALFRHPAVAEAAVFAVADEKLGEEVGAAVYLAAGHTLTADELRAFCREHLAAYKVPRYLWLLDAPLPRNANGKFLKRELQARLDPAQAA